MAAEKPRERSKATGEHPLSRLEYLEQGEDDNRWFDIRRDKRPLGGRRIKPAGGLALPLDLLTDGNSLCHAEFTPPEALISLTPQFIGPEPVQPLRRFSGRHVIAAAGTWIGGKDDRVLFRDKNVPWCRIGQVTRPDGKRGTGALVGKNFILTASHVVAGLWAAGRPLTQTITFVPAMNGGMSLLGPTWTAKVTGIAAWKDIDDVVGYDLALCQLDKPMGDWLGYFGARGYNEDWEGHDYWDHVGYPFDLSRDGDVPSVEFHITIDDDDNDEFNTVELETDADIASGQSGGPLWAVFSPGGRQIVGVLSGHDDDFAESSNVFAGGSGLSSLVKWGRDNWK